MRSYEIRIFTNGGSGWMTVNMQFQDSFDCDNYCLATWGRGNYDFRSL